MSSDEFTARTLRREAIGRVDHARAVDRRAIASQAPRTLRSRAGEAARRLRGTVGRRRP